MAIEALVTVGGYAFPEPSTYNATTSTLVDSARNIQGVMVGSVVRHDVAKIELTWRYLTVEQWAAITGPFNRDFMAEVRFFDQTTGRYDVRTMNGRYVAQTSRYWFRYGMDRLPNCTCGGVVHVSCF